jgi:nitrite reductase/ring-hydroxylating ferredoxin subunit
MSAKDTSGYRCDCVVRSTRRDVLAFVSIGGLDIVAGGVANSVFAEPADERPKRGDLLVAVDGAEMRPLTLADIPPTPLLAWPMDPLGQVVRSGSRLNKVLVVALDPTTLVGATRERAAGGVVAYSAICPHAGCEVDGWIPEQDIIECRCHNSRYNPRDAAAVLDGPSPRALSALPLEVADGKLVVAKPFVGRLGVVPV